MTRLAAAALAVFLLLLAAGCATAPTTSDPGGELSVSVANEDDVAYTVTVSVVPPDADGATVTYEDGTQRRVALDGDSPEVFARGTLVNATAVAADGEGARVESYRVGPDEGIGATYEVPRGSTVVHVVQRGAGAGSTRGVGVGGCDAGTDVTDLAVTVRSDGSLYTGLACRDRPQSG
jgi:ABC-type Fe3+-hydroxamate transport system substrate-binding protein